MRCSKRWRRACQSSPARSEGCRKLWKTTRSALLVPPAKPAAMASALARILEDPALAKRLAANASERLVRRFSPQSRYQALLKVYRAVKESP